jgi:protein-L-isoaspartate O-methyltransferase
VYRIKRKVPRHRFVPQEYEKDAYGDYPLPIGYGQTISQPYIVAFMTEAVKPDRNKKALEIGIVTAAIDKVPGPLIDQLAEGGRLVIPVGSPYGLQELKLLVKKNGKIKTTTQLPVRFVPFKRL